MKKTICLNMIVKNEAHIIHETLDCIKKYIDYWVICDTGSTDGTQDKIKEYFKKENIKGDLYQHEWKHFGHNRTLALKKCFNKSDYIWVIDADDIIIGDLILPEKMEDDSYQLIYGEGFTYYRTQLFENRKLKWKYVGVLHEYPDRNNGQPYISTAITGKYYVDSRRLGSRSNDPNKYLKDAQVLEQGLIDEPDNERYMFYLGQSYADCDRPKDSNKWYRKRIEKGGWHEEVYYSYYKIAQNLHRMKKKWEVIEKAYLEAHDFLPSRAEPLFEIAKYYRVKNDFVKGYEFASRATNIPYPEDQKLFITESVYDYLALDEKAICAYYLDKHDEAIKINQKLLNNSKVPDSYKERIKKNLLFSFSKIKTYLSDPIKYITNLRKISYSDLITHFNLEMHNQWYAMYNEMLSKYVHPKSRLFYEKYRELHVEYIKDQYLEKYTKEIKVSDGPIMFSITSCKRFDLFEKTMNSFINCCEDVHLINKWICVDDNSTDADRKLMKEQYPFFTFIFKTEKEKGHPKSMNIILDNIGDAKYLIHVEDDWHFFDKRNYVSEGLEILNENVEQVLFNVNYAEIELYKMPINGGIPKYTKNSKRYILHEHYDNSSLEYKEFMQSHGGSANAYWKHFSFRPSIAKTNVFKELGRYNEKASHFELEYAERFLKKGYKSAFFDNVNCLHTGKKTWEKNVKNAYNLNDEVQFGNKLKENNYRFKDYTFHKNKDSFGYDIAHIPNKSIEELKKICDNNNKCIGFNTYGYLKHKIEPINKFIDLPNVSYMNDGIYVKVIT